MARPENVLDPTTGPVAQFACELRRLREQAGRPTYRELAVHTHFSATMLSRAANGRSLPSLPLTLAFVQACGGDPTEWERRWHEVRASEPKAPAEVAQPQRPAPVRRPWRRWLLVAGLPAVVAGAVVYGIGAVRGGSLLDPTWVERTQHVSQRVDRQLPEPMDGDDPRARDCVADATSLATVPLLLPDGSQFGTLILRHSAKCGTDWASAHYANPQLFTVQLAAFRPADAAEVHSEWSNNTPPGSYGDMLSVAKGCVSVRAQVVTPTGVGPTAATGCLR